MEGIADVFRCFICMDKLRDARLCPHCSKLCCFACIHRWLVEQRSHCPHCRLPLRPHELVNCRWVGDITQQLESLQLQTVLTIPAASINISSGAAAADLCELHSEKLSVFCGTCKKCICHKCALWEGTHSGHSFFPLDKMYETHASKIKESISQLRRRLLEITNLIQDVERNVELVRSAKDEKVSEIRHAVDLIISRLDSQLRNKLLSLVAQKNVLTQETEHLEALLQETEMALQNQSKSQLIKNSGEMLCAVERAQRQAVSSFALHSVPADFQSEVVPAYNSSAFTIDDFSRCRNQSDPIYSQPLIVDGLKWRLKVYPDGNGIVRGNYLSVFLELTSGVVEPAKYEYRVELIYQGPNNGASANRNIVREFASEFDAGECWGYNRFFRLDLLASEGYLRPETNSLVLRFYVRPPTYYQKCRDLQRCLSSVLHKQSRYLTIIKDLTEGNRMDHPSHDDDESVEVGSGTTVSSAVDNATICLSNSRVSHNSALNSSAETDDALHLTDDVFEQNSPSQRLLNLTDTVRRLTGTFQNHSPQQHQDGEWVYTSSGSESPRSPNDNIVDDNHLSDGELELGEAVISVNQYIVQPIAGHSDVNFPPSSVLDDNGIFQLVEHPFSLDRNSTTVIASNVHTFAERDWDQGTLDVLQSGMESGGTMAIAVDGSARNSTHVSTGQTPISTVRKNRCPRDSSFILPRPGQLRRSISPPRAQAPLPAAAPPQQTSTFPTNSNAEE